jgi:uncharacterized iron-regulated membrane protein
MAVFICGERGLMGLEVTALLLAFGFALSGAMIWIERRPRRDFNVRLIPTTPFLLIGILIILAAGIHLLGMFGAH